MCALSISGTHDAVPTTQTRLRNRHRRDACLLLRRAYSMGRLRAFWPSRKSLLFMEFANNVVAGLDFFYQHP